MSDMAIDAARMMDMLPDEDKNFAYEFIKKLVKAWDPDFTKVTPEEAQRIKAQKKAALSRTAILTGIISAPSYNRRWIPLI